jgi:hypothetical protein
MSGSFEVTFEVIPSTFDVKNTGVVAIAILGGDGVDLSQIDLESIQLSRAVPQAVSYNGVSRLLAEFSSADMLQAIHAALGRAPIDGDSVTLELTGSLLDGTLIHGSATVLIHVPN